MIDSKGPQLLQPFSALVRLAAVHLALVDRPFDTQIISDVGIRICVLLIHNLKQAVVDKFLIFNIMNHII